MKQQPFCTLCISCEHPLSAHGWDPDSGGSLEAGPYVCQCGCAISQRGSEGERLTERQYRHRFPEGYPA